MGDKLGEMLVNLEFAFQPLKYAIAGVFIAYSAILFIAFSKIINLCTDSLHAELSLCSLVFI